jgi:hypothetical protein
MRSRPFHFFPLVFLFLLPVWAFAQPNDLNMESLAGKVKRIDEDTAVMKEKNGVLVEGSRNRTRSIIFDKQGRMTYEWIRIKDLDPKETNYTYEKNGRRTSRQVVIRPFADKDKPPFEQYSLSIVTFDKDQNILFRDVFIGNIADRNPTDMKIPTQKYQYIFDKDYRLLASVMLTLEGQEGSRDSYIYESGRLPVQRRLSMAGNPRLQVIKYTYKLDTRGNWIKRTEENTWADAKATKEWKVTYRQVTYYKN